MRPQGSPEELERRRRRGIELLKAGASVTEVARRLGCSHSSVILWREAVRRRGLKALTARPAPGRPSKLTAAQQRQLPRLLLRGATTWKFDTDLWTTGRIATVIHRTFGVRLHRAHVGRLLTTLGWSCPRRSSRTSLLPSRRGPGLAVVGGRRGCVARRQGCAPRGCPVPAL